LAKSGLRHIDVGAELTKTEWESEESHELIHGTSFPASPAERQLFYRDDEHKWYIYNGSAWVWLGGGSGGVTDHGELTGLGDDDHPQYIKHSLATAINDFLVASGVGVFVKKTLAEVKAILNWAADIATHAALSATHGRTNIDGVTERDSAISTHAALATGIHGVGASTVESIAGSQSKVDTHGALTTAHGAVSAPTASRIILRDAGGRAQVVAPSAAGDIARKDTVDTHATLSTNVHGIQDVPLFSTEAKTYYIDAVSGDDGNGGESSGDAFKTWAKAETMIPIFILHAYVIITLGNVPENILLEGRTTISGGSLYIKGNKETTAYYAVNKIDVSTCFGDIRIQYFRTTVDRTFVGYSMLPRLDGVRFITHDAATARAFDLEACIMALRDCDIGTDKATDGIFATNCRLVSHDNSGNATRYGLYANNSAVIAKRNGQPTGTTADEYTAYGGEIR